MMGANKKAAGCGNTDSGNRTSLTDSLSTSILPQDEAESQRIVTMIAKVLCRLYGEATGQELVVTSVKRRQNG